MCIAKGSRRTLSNREQEEIVTQFQRVPCPHCHSLNLAQDTVCLNCGKPVRDGMQKTVVLPAPRQGLNGRQKAFLRRYVFPPLVFVPLYCLLIVLFKMPHMNLIDWLTRPIQRPISGAFWNRPTVPWWLLLVLIAGALTGGVFYLIKPVTWED